MAGLRCRSVIGVLVAGSMIFSSTGAIAAAAPATTQVDPWAALSVMSGGASAVAVCGAAATAATAAQPAAGCVLPQLDVPPAATTETGPPQPIPVPPVEPAGTGLGISPLLLGLAAVLAGIGLYLVLHKKHGNSPA
jgi:hypothetical protein